MSHKTVRYIHGILHKALADAQRKGSVIRNVASLADAPKLSASKKREMRVWTAVELRDFLLGVASELLHPAPRSDAVEPAFPHHLPGPVSRRRSSGGCGRDG
ncbi:MAG TPA: hypothetical protein VKJ83_00745 [Actinomycetota bacterium]|nr:hypothetical protein [Actinomycetota bacterium]